MITSFLTTQIQNEEDHEVQAILCQGIAKMVICGIITDVEVSLSTLPVIAPELILVVGRKNTFENIYIPADDRK